MHIYSPHPLLLPKHLGLRRRQRNYPWFDGLPYDFYTLCFDVFFSLDGRKVIAVCPPWRNLSRALLPLNISLHDKQLHFTISYPRSDAIFDTNPVLEISLPAGFVPVQGTVLEFHWASFTQQCQVSINPFAHLAETKVPMTLVSVQKNNPLVWIKDWCLFYHRVHHVSHIVLYDNGSDNRNSLSDELNALAPKLAVQVIAWDFSYREQTGALNHLYRMLGSGSDYYLSFDIDEYLVNDTHQALETQLKTLTANTPAIQIPGFRVDRSQMRYRKKGWMRIFDCCATDTQACSPKPIFMNSGIAEVWIHEVFPAAPAPRKCSISHALKRLYALYNNVLTHDAWVLYHRLAQKLKALKALFVKSTAQQEAEKPPPNLYFYHFAALSTLWCPTKPDTHYRAHKQASVGIDPNLLAALKRAKLDEAH